MLGPIEMGGKSVEIIARGCGEDSNMEE